MPRPTVYVSQGVFTVYAGLIASGYDMVRPACDSLQRLINAIRECRWPERATAYFGQARTDACEVNPYWPRAFLLTLAALYLPDSAPCAYPDPSAAVRHIESLDAVNPEDRGRDTMEWVLALPDACHSLRAQPEFERLLSLYREAIDAFEYEGAASEARACIVRRMGVGSDRLPVVTIVPNPLQARELTDVVSIDEETYLISAEPDSSSCVHEMLHDLLKDALRRNRTVVGSFTHLLQPVLAQMLSLRYAWDSSSDSWYRVFEEHFVRTAEIWVTRGDAPVSARRTASTQAGYGFRYAPTLMECFLSRWPGMDRFDEFVLCCLESCGALA